MKWMRLMSVTNAWAVNRAWYLTMYPTLARGTQQKQIQ